MSSTTLQLHGRECNVEAEEAKVEESPSSQDIKQAQRRFDGIQAHQEVSLERIEDLKRQIRDIGWTDAQIEAAFREMSGGRSAIIRGLRGSNPEAQAFHTQKQTSTAVAPEVKGFSASVGTKEHDEKVADAEERRKQPHKSEMAVSQSESYDS